MENKKTETHKEAGTRVIGQLSSPMFIAIRKLMEEAFTEGVKWARNGGELQEAQQPELSHERSYSSQVRDDVPRFVPVTKWDMYFNDPSQGGMRWLVHSNADFRKQCVVRRGRRVLIDTEAYQRWLFTSLKPHEGTPSALMREQRPRRPYHRRALHDQSRGES